MRCALCSNTDNLFVNAVNDSGLILIFCRDCEDTPTLEAAARLAVENEKLRESLKSMEDCDNCKHSSKNIAEYPCNICDEGTDKWEAKHD